MEGETILNKFDYNNTEIKKLGDMKIVRKVSVKRGRGYKSVTKYRRGKKISSVKKPIHIEHLKMIKGGNFITGLFKDCVHCGKTRKRH
jgi:hypothetical protein